MAKKRHKGPGRQAAVSRHEGSAPAAASQAPAIVAHPPAKQPSLLAVSVVLFAAWFIFLLVTALLG